MACDWQTGYGKQNSWPELDAFLPSSDSGFKLKLWAFWAQIKTVWQPGGYPHGFG